MRYEYSTYFAGHTVYIFTACDSSTTVSQRAYKNTLTWTHWQTANKKLQLILYFLGITYTFVY